MADKRRRIKGRAHTDSEKAIVLQKILDMWKSMPELRLGQLIDNSIFFCKIELFYLEDDALVEAMETFTNVKGDKKT